LKIVLDEGVPENLAKYLPEHEVHSVRSLGWKGTVNGRLLTLIESVQPDTFITGDKNMEKQNNLLGRPFATLLLSTNYWPAIELKIEAVRGALEYVTPGEIKRVDCGRFIARRFRKQEP